MFELKHLIISASVPNNIGIDFENFTWLDTASRKVKTFNGKTWDVVADLADVINLPSSLEDMTLKGKTVIAGDLIMEGYEPVNAEIKTEGGVLVFKNGILVKYAS
jgi:hypothetical protein